MKYLTLILIFICTSSCAKPKSYEGLCDDVRKEPDLKHSIMPKNDMRIPVGDKDAGGLTKEQYDKVIDQISDVYAPIFADLGFTLVFIRDWESPEVNAHTWKEGNIVFIKMLGGLARHKEITEEAFLLVACHEVGHHLGGTPKYGTPQNPRHWASNEGQSDYYATNICMKRMYKALGITGIWNPLEKLDIAYMKYKCGRGQHNKRDRKICCMSSFAGRDLAAVFKDIRGGEQWLSFLLSDRKKVEQTNDIHPDYQCRLDTYFRGAVCDKSHTSNENCLRNEGYKFPVRPRCWYKPNS